ncbi:MAG: hypothetical protein HIU83_05840 [Proteobacteria bacterium]|nr:hypothetical protein [Pseudomonadota bacterium]
MKQLWNIVKFTMLGVVTAVALAACGGGGDSSPSTPTPAAKTISGTAAAGAPIIGSVTIKDSSTPTKTKTVQIAADGKYMVDVSDLKAPYMVRADGYVGGNEYHLYSAGTSADVDGTINVTPLTDLIVANIAKTVASDYYTSGNFSNLTADQLTAQSTALAAKLQPILTAVGVSSSIDLLRTSFATDHTKLDAALDLIKVTTNTTTNVATISNILTPETITSNLATQTYTGAMTATTTTAVTTTMATITNSGTTTPTTSMMTDIQKISAGFQTFSNLFATSLPSPTNTTLLGLFDSATFMQEGQSFPAFLTEMTTDKTMIGISFTNIAIKSIDTTNGKAVVGFSVIQNGTLANDAPDTWNMIKKADGNWYMQGDQRIAHVKVETLAEYQLRNTTSPIQTGLRLNIEDRGGKGITSAVVTGAGLPSGGVTLNNNIANHYFDIQPSGGNYYTMTDAAINTIADTGEIYTVKLFIGTTLAGTYTEKLRKRPYLHTELTSASFPQITKPTPTDLQALIGTSTDINATASWILPAGLTNDWLTVQVQDISGNSAMYETSLTPTQTIASFTLSPVTSTGTRFTISNGWIELGAWDSYGRSLAVSM